MARGVGMNRENISQLQQSIRDTSKKTKSHTSFRVNESDFEEVEDVCLISESRWLRYRGISRLTFPINASSIMFRSVQEARPEDVSAHSHSVQASLLGAGKFSLRETLITK